MILAPVLVQGDGAAPQIAAAIEKFNQLQCADVLIVGRGGGSMEDLWAFNEEIVARAVAASQIPVISAVGHETDFTICDFVADLRAPTPSAAAELATPDQEELKDVLLSYRYTISHLMRTQLQYKKQQLDELSACRYLADPGFWITERHQRLDVLAERLKATMKMQVSEQKSRLASFAGKLDGLSPLKVLERGFVYASDKKGKLIADAEQLAVGDAICLQMKNGTAHCTVDAVEKAGDHHE